MAETEHDRRLLAAYLLDDGWQLRDTGTPEQPSG
jgi:hypothetical protein